MPNIVLKKNDPVLAFGIDVSNSIDVLRLLNQ